MFIPNIEIEKFRGIRKSTINGFGQYVNLFIGKNNCGKSSVLDAIYLLFAGYKPKIIVDINGFRDFVKYNFHDTVSVLFYKQLPNETIQLKASLENWSQQVRISPLYKQNTNVEFKADAISQLGVEQYIEGLAVKNTISNVTDTVSYVAKIIEEAPLKDKMLRATIKSLQTPELDFEVVYISSKASLQIEVSLIEEIIERKEVSVIVQALQLIDSRIVDIAILKERVFVDIGFEKLMPVEILGDGVRRTITIISNLYKCKNGILLVDEFDNGIHYSSLPTIWSSIIEMAHRYNVQFFATTHNIDSLKTLNDTAAKLSVEIQNEIRCIKLEQSNDDNLIAYNYSFPEFSYAIEMEHEIR